MMRVGQSVAVLSTEQQAEFDRTGVLKLEAVFNAGESARMRDVVWSELRHRYEIDRDDRATWDRHPPTGMRSSKKHHAFAPILGPIMTGALDDLFGPERWMPPKHYGQVLITMPNATEWRVPHKLWHGDFQYQHRPERLFSVKYWALFADLPPGGGGTPQLAGSHRLVARYVEGRSPQELEYKRVRDGFLRSHPWLRALCKDDGDPDRNLQFMGTEVDIDGLPARVIELTGNAGDVFITHPWVMHTIAGNARDEPRLMRSMAINRRQSPMKTDREMLRSGDEG